MKKGYLVVIKPMEIGVMHFTSNAEAKAPLHLAKVYWTQVAGSIEIFNQMTRSVHDASMVNAVLQAVNVHQLVHQKLSSAPLALHAARRQICSCCCS